MGERRFFINQYWAAGMGLIYLAGRIIYAKDCLKDPGSRGPGMAMSSLPSIVLFLGGLAGAVWSLVS